MPLSPAFITFALAAAFAPAPPRHAPRMGEELDPDRLGEVLVEGFTADIDRNLALNGGAASAARELGEALVYRLANPAAVAAVAVGAVDRNRTGLVVRVAAKPRGNASSPSSPGYTTRKPALVGPARLEPSGVAGDYNHYRTRALGSTPDRAVSLLTTDVLESLAAEKARFWAAALEPGDLGENLLVAGVPYAFFAVGARYEVGGATIEISEPVVPCANLCKLGFVNDAALKPAARVARCKRFLERLGGVRGWYARVVRAGDVVVGDAVRLGLG